MLYSNNHLKAEADYRREVLSRTVPLDTPEIFHLEPRERRIGPFTETRDPLLRARSALARLVEVVIARATRSGRRSHA